MHQEPPTSPSQLIGWLILAAIAAATSGIGALALSYSKARLVDWKIAKGKTGHAIFGLGAVVAGFAIAVGLVHVAAPGSFLVTAIAALVGVSAGATFAGSRMVRNVAKGTVEARRGLKASDAPNRQEIYFARPGATWFLESAESVLASFPEIAKISGSSEIEVESADGAFRVLFRYDGQLGQTDNAYRAFLCATGSADLSDSAARTTYIAGQLTDRFKRLVGSLSRSYSVPVRSQNLPASPAATPAFPSPRDFDAVFDNEMMDLESSLEQTFGLIGLTFAVTDYKLSEQSQQALDDLFETTEAVRAAQNSLRAVGFEPPAERKALLERAYRAHRNIPPGAALNGIQEQEIDAQLAPYREDYVAKTLSWMRVNSDSSTVNTYEFAGLPQNLTAFGFGGDGGMGGAVGGGPRRQPQGPPQGGQQPGQPQGGQGGGRRRKRNRGGNRGGNGNP